ncbi:MFS transporter [Deinococcus geothermalis]|uniref:MFS transporter n=1 Tax=Deinococcus geothermalis TaxID=68909 RepID=UPI0012F850E2|nr:MFS transporter [Deinococcus geothermalis]
MSGTPVGLSQQPATPFGRLLTGMVVGQFGYTLATVIPLALLLTFKFLALDPQHATAHFSAAVGIGSLVSLVSFFVGGALSDRTGLRVGRRRPWILLGTLVGAAALVALGVATTVAAVTLLWCAVQAGYTFANAAYSALIPDQVQETRRGTASGVIGMFNPLAIMLGFTLMTALNNLPLTNKFNFLALVSVVGALVACLLVREHKHYYVAPRTQRLSLPERLSRIYPNPRRYPAFSWAFATRLFAGLAFATQTFGALYLIQRFQVPQDRVAGMMALTTLTSTLGLALASVLGGMLSDRVRKQKPFVAVSAVILALGLLIQALAPGFPVFMIGGAVLGIGFGAFLAVDIALVARILPSKEDAAKDFGIMNIAGALPNSIAPALAPMLIGLGGFPLFFGVFALFGLLSAVAVAPIPEMSPHPQPAESSAPVQPDLAV